MRTHPRMPLIALITATTVLGVCSTALSAGSGAERQSALARFSAHVDNPWFPLTPGTTYIYRGVKDGHTARDVLTVTHRTAMIDGVPCVVVKDRLYLDGRLEERTTDWYTQDRKGNVWYFGEVTAQLDASGKVRAPKAVGEPASTRRSPVSTCQPTRTADSRDGRSSSRDRPRITSGYSVCVRGVRVPYVTSRHALLTEEWTPLEPGVLDHKLYVRGIGTVLEKAVKGGDERLALVAFDRGT